jgi:hypothetical protein
MDGRRLRLWVSGGLVCAALGCTRNTNPGGVTLPKPGETAGPILPAGGVSKWSGNTPTQQPPPELTTQQPIPTSSRKKGAPPKPETEVAIADVWVAQALSHDSPADRERLLDKARLAYQRAVQQDPKNKTALLAMAKFYGKIEDRPRTDEAYGKYLALYPKDHEVMAEVAKVHARWQDWDGAVAWGQKALAHDPENRTYRGSMAVWLSLAGKLQDGFAVLCQIMPEANARYYIGRMMLDAGQEDAGRQQVALALQADPNLTAAREFQAALNAAPQENPVRAVVHQEPSRPGN